MRKVLSLLLCVMMVVTMMPSMAFAGAGTPPGQLYWSGVPNSVTDSSAPTDIEWYGDGGMPIGFTNDTVRRVYLGVEDAQGNIQPISVDPALLECGSNISVTGRDGYIYTLTAQAVNAQTWIRYTGPEQDYELGIDIALGDEGGQPPVGNPPEALYFIFAGNNITLGDNNVILIDGVAYENTDENPNAVANAIDRYAVSAIESQLGGRSGYFVVKGNSALRAVYGVESSNSNLVDIRSRDNGVQEIRLKSPGTAYLTLTSDDGIYNWEMKVTGTISGLNIRGGGWTAAPGNIGNGIFMSQMEVYDGNTRLTESQYSVKLTDETIGTVGITPGNTIEFVPKAAGQTTMVITYGGQEYYYQLNVEEQDLNQGGNQGGTGGEAKWHMIFSDVVIDEGNRPSNLSQTRTGVQIPGTSSSANYYLYLVEFDAENNVLQIEPVTTENFEIKYMRGEPDHIEGTGVLIRKADDGIEWTDNYYQFLTDRTQQEDYEVGQGMYDVWPRAEGDNRLIYNSWIDTSGNGGGSGEGPEEFDIFVLSSRDDLAELTEQDIMNELDFAIIEASLTHEDRTFTGYAYVATQKRVNNHWVYAGFRELHEYERIFVDYSAGNGNWVDSINGTVTGLTVDKNTDGTWTVKYHGVNTDEVKVNGENTYGYSLGLYEAVPEGIHYTCECMPFQFMFMETAPVADAEYDLNMEQLVDPEIFTNNYPHDLGRMAVWGQGENMSFNSRIPSWYSCFYVRNKVNSYDARYIPAQDTREERTYIGAEGQFHIEACSRAGGEWVAIETLPAADQVFSVEYVGAKKGFYPVFKITFDYDKDDISHATDNYWFRLFYTGADPYLDNGNNHNDRSIELSRNENLAEFDIDEYWFDETVEDYGNVNHLHFDFIGTANRFKMNIRPGVLQGIADKIYFNANDYIFIENEVENIQVYRFDHSQDGPNRLVALNGEESPFTITWDDEAKEYIVTYDKPDSDLYGPHYVLKYTGDYNSKINEAYGYPEGTVHDVHNDSTLTTGKVTVSIDEVGDDGVIDATTEDEILGTEVIIGEGAVGDHTELEINTNDGNITLGGALVGNIKIKNGKVHFKMWNVKEEKHYTNDAQDNEIKKAKKAFDFKIDFDDADIDFGEDGYATIRIPYDGDEGYIYYINEKGEKEYVACVCEDGYIEFTARHFSVYAISDESPDLTAPKAEISIDENVWNTLLNTITFGKFFNDTQTVTIKAADEEEGSGVAQVSYILAKSELSEDELQTAEWIAYTGPFSITPDNAYIIYAKAEDAAGNTVFISSEGIVLDATAPVIAGIADGDVYYGDTSFTVTEDYIDSVKVDGEEVELADGNYTIEADGMEHTITAEDKAGNSCAAVTITVIAVDSLDDTIADITADNVKISNETAVQAVLDQVNALLNGEKEFTSEEQTSLSSMKANAEALLGKIAADQKVLNDALKAAEEITLDNVKSSDEDALKEAKSTLESVLSDTNYTEEEAAEVQAEIDRIGKLLEKVEELKKAESDDDGSGSNPGTPGGSGGGGGYVPITPPASDNVTNESGSTTEAPSTNADVTDTVTNKGGNTSATVDQTTADKIVEKAVENKSEEIVIDATFKNESAAHSTKSAEVELPAETLGQIAEKTDADVTLKTDVAEITLDNAAAGAIAEQAKGSSVSIVAEKVKEEKDAVHFELKVVCSEGNVISDFKGGNVTITVTLPKNLQNKEVVCVYIDESGHWHKVQGLAAGKEQYVFQTGHFSEYAIMLLEEVEAAIAEQKATVKAMKFKLSSKLVTMKTGKKAVKLTWDTGSDVEFDGIAIYRSMKKNSGYGKKSYFVTTKDTYYNTAIKNGKKYFYKVRGFVVIDGEKVYTDYSYKAWRTIK